MLGIVPRELHKERTTSLGSILAGCNRALAVIRKRDILTGRGPWLTLTPNWRDHYLLCTLRRCYPNGPLGDGQPIPTWN